MSMRLRIAAFALGILASGACTAAQTTATKGSTPPELDNGILTVRFGARGMTEIESHVLQRVYRIAGDEFSVHAGGGDIRSEQLGAPGVSREKSAIVYTFAARGYRVRVVYELRAGWAFVSKQVFVIADAPSVTFHVGEVQPVRLLLVDRPVSTYIPQNRSWSKRMGGKDFGAFFRFADRTGLLILVQNPFLDVTHDRSGFGLAYSAEMDWTPANGPFPSDRACIGPYALTGRSVPVEMIPEWKWETAGAQPGGEIEDEAEIDAFEDCVRAFRLPATARSTKIEIGWTLNDYQIDIATRDGREEYKRVIDRAAALGLDHLLFAPSNSQLALTKDDTDSWHWEHVLWLGLGQRIRKGEWNPETGTIPASVQEMLGYAKTKNVKLVAYVYPILPFTANPAWLVGEHKDAANLGFRSLQDWLIKNLLAFYRRTGIGGYAFDYTFLNQPGASEYAQWRGWRRVMETLRRAEPDIVMDGRQSYQNYGPWSWLAGSYPHPTSTDEQPESFVPFPDLHFDRVSADRERYTAYRYRIRDFCPPELMPGYIAHQTPRNDDKGDLVETEFRQRDWDYLGWRYSLISSIAVGGLNNVSDMIPARDIAEYEHFSAADIAFFRHWIEWTDANRAYLLHTRFILGQPAIGRVDGTSAMLGDRGYIFLFNPNARKEEATFKLDASIGLGGGEHEQFVLREIYPSDGPRIGSARAAFWRRGESASISMDGASALVLRVEAAPGRIEQPVIFNVPGSASLSGEELSVSGVSGEAGKAQDVTVVLPAGKKVSKVSVNGEEIPFARDGDILHLALKFIGEAFDHMQQVGEYDPSFAGGMFTGHFRIPQRIFDQLRARQAAWPIPWTAEDAKTPWLEPQRLLLFVQIAEPSDQMQVALKLNGEAVELRKAYSSVWPDARSFVGFYADVSSLEADREYEVKLQLPPLRPGQFQGVFFENVEPEMTARIAK